PRPAKLLATALMSLNANAEGRGIRDNMPRQAADVRKPTIATVKDDKNHQKAIVSTALFVVDRMLMVNCDPPALTKLLNDLAETALADDKAFIDRAIALDQERRTDEAAQAANTTQLNATIAQRDAMLARMRTTSFASSRNTKRLYPISPGEVQNFFLSKNL